MEQGKQTKQNGMDGGKQTERGQLLMRAVGMAGKGWQANSLLNKALQANTASGLSARLRPQNKQPADGRSRSKHNSC